MPIENICGDKTRLRSEYRARRAAMLSQEKHQRDEQIARAVCSLEQYRRNQWLLIYVSMPLEVDTRRIIRQAWQDGKRVAVPRCVPQTREMDFYEIRSFEDLTSGTFGVEEPLPKPGNLATDLKQGLCIVPALCYDREGYRLGYGKGYYDRFLARFKGDVIGICYSDEVLLRLPRDRFDCAVDTVVTDECIRQISQ